MKKILIIEPDPALSWIICEGLRDGGYDPLPCAPERAAELAAELPASAVVAALSLVALEATPLYRALRGDPRTKDIPMIVITGRGDTTLRRRLGERPPYVLFKPFELEDLLHTVSQALGGA